MATVITGLVLRLVPLGIPYSITKYGGSALWAVMVYLLMAAGMPRVRPAHLAAVVVAFAWAVELSRLFHSPGMDAFRLTLAGALLLGRVFSWWHLLIYGLAIGLTAIADDVMSGRGRSLK